jgi:hypothetical protein
MGLVNPDEEAQIFTPTPYCPEATYVVAWSEVKAGQKSRAYITPVKEKYADLVILFLICP